MAFLDYETSKAIAEPHVQTYTLNSFSQVKTVEWHFRGRKKLSSFQEK